MSGDARDSSARKALDALQTELLEGFFGLEQGFFLTGGAALVGFHLGHRRTRDLDLFTLEQNLEAGVAALHAAAEDLGASLEALRTSPTFRRFLIRRGAETTVVDLVLERAPQVATKTRYGAIRVDPPEEILANKLCTLLSRAELRDLVDVRALELAGYRVEDALVPAACKDAGLTAAQLAWVLSEVEIGDDAEPPGVGARELREYLHGLVRRLSRLALPAG